MGLVCKVIFMSNPTVVLRLGWAFDNSARAYSTLVVLVFYVSVTMCDISSVWHLFLSASEL